MFRYLVVHLFLPDNNKGKATLDLGGGAKQAGQAARTFREGSVMDWMDRHFSTKTQGNLYRITFKCTYFYYNRVHLVHIVYLYNLKIIILLKLTMYIHTAILKRIRTICMPFPQKIIMTLRLFENY
jgi:hypothetical protein